MKIKPENILWTKPRQEPKRETSEDETEWQNVTRAEKEAILAKIKAEQKELVLDINFNK